MEHSGSNELANSCQFRLQLTQHPLLALHLLLRVAGQTNFTRGWQAYGPFNLQSSHLTEAKGMFPRTLVNCPRMVSEPLAKTQGEI